MKRAVLVLLITAVVFSGFSCSRQNQENIYRKNGIIMDTLVTITVAANSPKQANSAIDAAFAELRHLEKLISFWDPKSEISAMNREAGIRPVKVSPETMDLLEKALFVSKKTDGAFDCTIGPEIRQWDFKKKIMPGPEAIKRALSLVDYRAVKLDKANSTAFLDRKGMSFDTGGIAKGWGADMAEAVLKANGIKAGLIAIAGDIKAFGRKPDGHGWIVGIENPRPEGKNDQVLARIELVDEGISTAGDYERCFFINGVMYHHILNPKTGYPARGFESVSLITPKGVWSDGFDDGIFVLGPEKGIALVKELGFNAITVDSSGKLGITSGIRPRVTLFTGKGKVQ